MNPSCHQIVFFALYERFIAYPPINDIFTVFAARGFMRIRLESDPWGARSGAAGTLRGGIRPCRRAVRHAVRPQPRLLRFPNSDGFVYSQQKRKNYLRLKKTPFGAFCFAHVVSRSTISEQSTTRLFTLFPPSISRIVFAAVMLWSYSILSRDVNAGVDISA